MSDLSWDVLTGPATEVAPRLLGSLLVRHVDGQRLVGRIVETEAYDETDAASHSVSGINGRAKITFGPAGHVYVHAMRHHFLCDITCGQENYGASVLIRAIEPLEGVEVMRRFRNSAPADQLANGPGKLCQALAIDKHLNGHDLHVPPLQLTLLPPLPPAQIVTALRVGITKDVDRPWRFYLKDSLHISRKA